VIARTLLRLTTLALLLALLLAASGAFAGTNVVGPTGADDTRLAINANALKPPECAALNLTSVVVGSGTINGGGGSSLILGSAGADTISGQGGNDCILGGGGNDILRGGRGAEVLIGGPGADQLDGGSGSDACYGYNATTSGGGIDTFVNCETQVP
jgi:Ca2+-binding RTX toxin-like protein